MMEAVTAIGYEAFALTAAMAPYMFLGLAAAGALHVILPLGVVARHLGGAGVLPVLKAVLLGVPLPVCSCGVVPIAASLRKAGASDGATVGFLITTPTTGVDSILATYSVLGGGFAALRVAVTTVLGLIAGLGTALVSRDRAAVLAAPATPIVPQEPSLGARGAAAKSVRYALGELMGDIAKPFALGIVLGAIITYFVPAGLLEQTIGRGFLSYLVMMVVGIPLYVCASGSIPLAVALIAKGLSPGAALVFLIAGPATNVATVAIVGKELGLKTAAVYLTTLSLGSLAAGYVADALFAAFPAMLPPSALLAGASHETVPSLGALEKISGVVLIVLVAYHLVAPAVRSFRGRGALARAAKENAGVIRINVPEMTCGHCAGTVRAAIEKVDGVRFVDADPQSRIASVETEDADGKNRVLTAIREAGFHSEILEKKK